MSPEAMAWLLTLLLAAAYLAPDVAVWLEVRAEKRAAVSRKALARKDQS